MFSIKRQLRHGLALSLVLGMTLIGIVLGLVLTRMAEEYMVARLAADGDSVLEALTIDPATQQLSVPAGRVGATYQRAFSGHYWLLLGVDDSELRSRSLWDETLTVQRQPQGETRYGYQQGPLDQRLLVWSGGFRKQGVLVTIVVAEDLSALLSGYRTLVWTFVALSIGVLLLLLLVQGRLITRGFAPVEHTLRELRQLRRGELRALGGEVPDELRPLVAEVNHLLSLFSDRLRRSRNAVGNLAHALKAPLGILQGLAERPEALADAAVATELRSQTTQIQHLLARELKRARLAGSGVPGQHFDAAVELPTLVALLEKMHAAREVRFDCAASSAWVFQFDRDDMLELLGNLLDNAGKWADERVRCRLSRSGQDVEGGADSGGGMGGGLSLLVEDDGPGCDEALLRQLTERGVRIDEGVPGHGLGLAIVRDIVVEYGGQLRFSRSPTLGGLRVEVELPAASSRPADSG